MRLVDRVASFLFDRRMLLVLDNFEHVASAATVVAEVLAACPLVDGAGHQPREPAIVGRARIPGRAARAARPG